MTTFYTIVGFTFLLTFLLAFYGVSVGNNSILNTMNQITGDWPVVTSSHCSFSSSGPTGGCNVLDTATLGTVWVFAVAGSFLYRLGAVLFLFYDIFAVLNAVSGAPFLGWLFTFLLFIVAVESFLVLRSGKLSA